MNTKKFITAILLILFFNNSNCAILIFDIGGVLIETSPAKAFLQLGIEVIPHTDLKIRFFEFLNYIDKEHGNDSKATFRGLKLPSYMCQWQEGKITCQELTDYVLQEIDNHPNFFKSKTERNLMKKTASFFLPPKNIKISVPIKNMVKTVKDCKNKRDRHGKPVNTLYIGSNCNMGTYEEIKKQFPEIIALFDEDKITISGEIDVMKPNEDFYCYIINKYNLDPKKCTFIDDQKENIDGARKCGMNGIVHKTTAQTRKRLRQVGAL